MASLFEPGKYGAFNTINLSDHTTLFRSSWGQISQKMIALTQTPFSMSLWIWTTKYQFWSLVCIAIYFHFFVCNISIILNIILSVCPFYFTGFFLLSLINETMFPMLLRQMFWKLFSQTKIIFCVIECIRICESNVFDTCRWTLYINLYI